MFKDYVGFREGNDLRLFIHILKSELILNVSSPSALASFVGTAHNQQIYLPSCLLFSNTFSTCYSDLGRQTNVRNFIWIPAEQPHFLGELVKTAIFNPTSWTKYKMRHAASLLTANIHRYFHVIQKRASIRRHNWPLLNFELPLFEQDLHEWTCRSFKIWNNRQEKWNIRKTFVLESFHLSILEL